jgi:predicted Rossmann-fold nucleotide-binding protein
MLVFAAKVYVYFPGGFGTLDEFSEVLTLMQTHKMARAPIFLYGTEFWSGFDQFVASTLETKFQTISAGDRELYKITDDIQEIVAAAVAETRSIEEAIQIAANAPDAKRDGRVI